MVCLHEILCRKQCKKRAYDTVKFIDIRLASLFVAKTISCISPSLIHDMYPALQLNQVISRGQFTNSLWSVVLPSLAQSDLRPIFLFILLKQHTFTVFFFVLVSSYLALLLIAGISWNLMCLRTCVHTEQSSLCESSLSSSFPSFPYLLRSPCWGIFVSFPVT